MELKNPQENLYADLLKTIGDLKTNYGNYMITEPIDCNEELKRVPGADYELCTALLTMLLREDHFSNGSFEWRFADGQVPSQYSFQLLPSLQTACEPSPVFRRPYL